MKTVQTDVAIIGVGTAGMTAYKAARKHTQNILTIEQAHYGTTCARVGCMPSKLLIAAGLAAQQARQSGPLGIHIPQVEVDGQAVMQRVRDERDRFAQFSVDEVLAWPAEHRIRGSARFVAPDTLQVDDTLQIKARSIVIATGSSPVVPADLKAALGDRLIINDDVFDWQTLPKSVAVMGTGVIGLELAYALHFLGVRVRLLGRSGKVGPATDPEVAKASADITASTLPCALQSRLKNTRRTANGIEIEYESAGQTLTKPFDYLLMATGRSPNLKQLDLPAAGIEVNDKGLPDFDPLTRQIGQLPIFIAGDVNQYHPVLHEAADDGHAAGSNAGSFPQLKPFMRRTSLSVVFSHPQIALAGQTYRQLEESGTDFEIGSVNFSNQGRSRIEQQNHGLLRVYGDTTNGKLLGAEMIGPAAEHLAHLLAWSIQQQQTIDQLLACPFYHPVVEEGLRTALRQLQGKLRQRAAK